MNNVTDVWKNLIEYRAQTSSWDLSQPVDKDLITNCLDDIHRRCPSKQNRVPYEIHILDWSNTEVRNDFYEFAVDRDNPNYRYNSQTLGHYLFVFVARIGRPSSVDFSPLNGQLDERISHLEIGLASYMLVHSLKSRGIDSGFCRCFDYNGPFGEKVRKHLGISRIYDIYLSVGAGIPGQDKYKTLNLHTNELVDAWNDNGSKWQLEPKPPATDYIKYHTHE